MEKNKIPINQGGEAPKHWKLWNTYKIKDDSKKWEDIPCSWIGGINLFKWPHYPKRSVDLMQSLSKYWWHFSQN